MTQFSLKVLSIQKEIELQKSPKKSHLCKSCFGSLVLQGAEDSSAIENIITTHDELYRANDIDSVTNEIYP